MNRGQGRRGRGRRAYSYGSSYSNSYGSSSSSHSRSSFSSSTRGARRGGFQFSAAAQDRLMKKLQKLEEEHQGEVITESGNLEAESGVNTVDSVDWYALANAEEHHTSEYELVQDEEDPMAVLRRGQMFKIAITFMKRNFDVKKDNIVLSFNLGDSPSLMKGTQAIVSVKGFSFTLSQHDWDCRIDPETKGKKLVLQISLPAKVPVGKWDLLVKSALQEDSETKPINYLDETGVYIIFNPFCKDDAVFMVDEDKRQQFVMQDKGRVFMGAYNKPKGRAWEFGQFDDVVLPVAFHLLEFEELRPSFWGNPVAVTRTLTAAVNSNDKGGIIIGNWSGNYSDGIAPTQWTSSVAVLEKFVENNFEPVRYGQCWVYSAVTTTICRALGIPCRSVTNYVSAHDKNASLTIDKFFTKDGVELKEIEKDSTWNFHVWNDVWMDRPDLPAGYGGWQAIDACPQEMSDNKFQCGPASHEAIKRGEIGLNYDGTFVFSEVNADIMYWFEDPSSPFGFSTRKISKYSVGKLILTDSPDDSGKTDILESYKGKEGSASERLATYNAITSSRRAQKYYQVEAPKVEDVVFDLLDIETVKVGDPIEAKIIMHNTGSEKRIVTAALVMNSYFYTGLKYMEIKKKENKVLIEPNKKMQLVLDVSYNEYWKKLQEHCHVKMYASCHVEDTNQTFFEEDDFTIDKPDLEIEGPAIAVLKKPAEYILSFTNPLDEELTGMRLNVDGSGMSAPILIEVEGTVPAGGEFKYTHTFKPKKVGRRQIVVVFTADQMCDIQGEKIVNVVDK